MAPRKSSVIWELCSDMPNDDKHAKCNLCGEILEKGGFKDG